MPVITLYSDPSKAEEEEEEIIRFDPSVLLCPASCAGPMDQHSWGAPMEDEMHWVPQPEGEEVPRWLA